MSKMMNAQLVKGMQRCECCGRLFMPDEMVGDLCIDCYTEINNH